MIYDFYRSKSFPGRPPARAGAGAGAGAAAVGEKSLADPSHSRIIAHSFARTHDTCTKTKPKSISRLGSLKDSPPNLQYIYTCVYIYIYIRMVRMNIGGWGGESVRDPNREIDFGFVFVHVSCVRAKLCAMIPLWLGVAKLFSAAPAPPPAAAVGGRTSRGVPAILSRKNHKSSLNQCLKKFDFCAKS